MPELAGLLPPEALASPRHPAAAWRATLADYVALTKPRIISLLVLTSVCAMVAGAGGAPRLAPVMALLFVAVSVDAVIR